MKKVLITGSNGLLGQKLLHLLHAPIYQGKVEVVATSRGANRLSQIPEMRYQSMDITQLADIERVFEEVKPDAVINTAAMTQVDTCETEREACWQLNVTAVAHLVKACQNHQAFLLHLSTDFIFDGTEGPYPEEGKANPLSYYGESKWASEQVVSQSNLDWAIARTVLVYGITEAMSRSNIILWVKKSLEEGKTIHVVDDQWRTPTLAEDLALGCYLIVDKAARGVYNISGEDFLTPYEMAIQTADFFHLDKSLIVRTDASRFSQPAKRPPRTGFIIDKAKQDLGYRPRSFSEGIAILNKQMQAMINE